jgi:hypothetical protein
VKKIEVEWSWKVTSMVEEEREKMGNIHML